MLRKILKVLGWLLLALLLLFAFGLWRNWDTVQRVFLGGVKVYESEAPTLPADIKRPAILVFSKANPKVLYFGNQKVFRTSDGGQHWRTISPDLSRENPALPPSHAA